MKYIYRILFIGVVISTLLSCTEGDTAADRLLNNVDKTGVILRTLEPPIEFAVAVDENMNTISITFEVQEANGDIMPEFKEVRVYGEIFEDQDLLTPIVDDEGKSIVQLLTLTPDMFEESENGLPFTTASFNILDDLVPAFVNPTFTTPTFLKTSLEIEMSDGRIFNSDSVSQASIGTNNFFKSPFAYMTIIVAL